MAIPDYQSIMLPLLKFAGDGEEHSLREAIEDLADEFSLTDEERKELLPSGRQATFDNRVGWARTYMKKAGLLESTKCRPS
jgi:restriction system protein